MTSQISGHIAPGMEPVCAAFEASLAECGAGGAALSIYQEGRPVIDVWGGAADPRANIAWTEPTATVIFSCTKGLMSILAARLVEDGQLAYDAPVARYWPAFAQKGKAQVTVADLLAHRAGLSAPRCDVGLDQALDWQAMTDILAAQEPLWPLGRGYAYHALTHGWLIGEVIRRVTGTPIGEHFANEIATPLGADAWIGLPDKHERRVAHIGTGHEYRAYWATQADTDTLETPNWPLRAMTLGRALPGSLVTETGGFNDPQVHRAAIPGAGGIATARGLAAIWSATVTDTHGHRLLDPDTVARATAPQTEGPPVFDVPGPYPRWGMGLQLDSDARHYLGASSFGHDGAGGQCAFADPERRIGFAFITNWMSGGEDQRATRIVEALRQTLGV